MVTRFWVPFYLNRLNQKSNKANQTSQTLFGRVLTPLNSQRETGNRKGRSSWFTDGASSRGDHPVDVLTRQSKVRGAIVGGEGFIV